MSWKFQPGNNIAAAGNEKLTTKMQGPPMRNECVTHPEPVHHGYTTHTPPVIQQIGRKWNPYFEVGLFQSPAKCVCS